MTRCHEEGPNTSAQPPSQGAEGWDETWRHTGDQGRIWAHPLWEENTSLCQIQTKGNTPCVEELTFGKVTEATSPPESVGVLPLDFPERVRMCCWKGDINIINYHQGKTSKSSKWVPGRSDLQQPPRSSSSNCLLRQSTQGLKRGLCLRLLFPQRRDKQNRNGGHLLPTSNHHPPCTGSWAGEMHPHMS